MLATSFRPTFRPVDGPGSRRRPRARAEDSPGHRAEPADSGPDAGITLGIDAQNGEALPNTHLVRTFDAIVTVTRVTAPRRRHARVPATFADPHADNGHLTTNRDADKPVTRRACIKQNFAPSPADSDSPTNTMPFEYFYPHGTRPAPSRRRKTSTHVSLDTPKSRHARRQRRGRDGPALGGAYTHLMPVQSYDTPTD